MSRLTAPLRRALPEAAKPLLRGVANGADPLLRALTRGGGPVPPRALRASVGQPSPSRYRAEGKIVAAELRNLLAGCGYDLRDFVSVCDLASGPGKVLSELRLGSGTALAAIDVNAEAIAWLSRHMPRVDARAERALPPTSFADESFDLIVSISLFTHLPEGSQLAWVEEVGRLLRPDGLGLLTIHGETAYEGFRAGQRPNVTSRQLASLRARGPLSAERFVFEPERHPERRSPGVERDYGLAFHSHEYVREGWGRRLEVERILPASINFRQDAVLVRRPAASR